MYELTRNSTAKVYVRYLPFGVKAGAPKGDYLIVATYPFPGAYEALQRPTARSKPFPAAASPSSTPATRRASTSPSPASTTRSRSTTRRRSGHSRSRYRETCSRSADAPR
jgi:hypothetical protein